ncbi:MAG TPA: SDR family oxidoreductase [Saprospiraceae bacterium]|nr:SDR family oxidoreductase [Saprospiraceae bacterium]HMQ83487.1 SDR family oxidoreductase [Saprospiraceae bacterium]
MDLNLSGKNALVCGSSKGIGKATAIELAALGANVTLVSRSAHIMIDIVRELDQSQGQRHDFLVADFTDTGDLQRKIKGLIATKNIHILINNTGGPAAGPILKANTEELLQAFNNHVICSHLLTQAVVPGMIQDGYGRIVNIISTSVKAPLDNLGVSNTVRAAMGNWAKTMANELGTHRITVNNVLPGFTATERLQEIIDLKVQKTGMPEEIVIQDMKKEAPIGRFADPSEIGAAAAFLASPAAAYITGINLPVDGGRLKNL